MLAPPRTTITKDYSKTTTETTTYNVTYLDRDIVTTVTKSSTAVTSWITHIKSIHQPTIVGLDTESQNPISTLQLCVSNNCLVYQITHSAHDIPPSLRNFLNDPNWVFSGVGVRSDAKYLAKDYGLVVAKTLDVSRVAADMGKARVNAGLKEVTKAVLGWEFEKCKEVTLSQWDSEVLDDGQVMYACLDAFVSYHIAKELSIIDHGYEHDRVEKG